MKNGNSQQGQSLMELLIGIAIAGGVLTAIAAMVFGSMMGSKVARERSVAQTLVNDMYASLQSVAQNDWHSLWGSSGAVAYWPLDDGAGTATTTNATAIDEIGGNNGALSLGATGNTSLANAWQSGSSCKAGGCVSFDGTDDAMPVADSGSLDLAGAVTVSAWINSANLTGAHTILAKRHASLTEANYGFRTTGTDLDFYWTSGGVWQVRSSSGAGLALNTWYHVAATYDGSSTVAMYVNGSLITSFCTSGTCTGALGTNADTLVIGRAGDYLGEYFNGKLDDIRMYNRVLSSTEIASLASGINALHPVNASGSWSMAEGQESVQNGNATFSRFLTLLPVQRNNANAIVASGGVNDPFTKQVTLSVQWNGRTLNETTYLQRSASNQVFAQADWSGGSGQAGPIFSSTNQFASASSSMTFSVANTLNGSSTGGYLTSSIFDTQRSGGVGIANIVWEGTLGAGTVTFKIAASNASSGPWNFIGADGTVSSSFPLSGTSQADTTINVSSVESLYNQRYFRYQIYMTAATTTSISVDYSQ